MKIYHSNLHWFLIASLLLGPLAQVCAAAPAIPMRSFAASYELHRGDRHIANMELRLERGAKDWRWVSRTRARGLYAWFTRKVAYAETRFDTIEEPFTLREIRIGENGGENPSEIALFDWQNRRAGVVRKGRRRELMLADEVFDYQSIHLLAAAMQLQLVERRSVDFYRKGELVKSNLVACGLKTIEFANRSVEARCYEQDVDKSDSTIRYFYDSENPLLPLRIERYGDDDIPSVLKLRRVEWDL